MFCISGEQTKGTFSLDLNDWLFVRLVVSAPSSFCSSFVVVLSSSSISISSQAYFIKYYINWYKVRQRYFYIFTISSSITSGFIESEEDFRPSASWISFTKYLFLSSTHKLSIHILLVEIVWNIVWKFLIY
jgi:hypothetical protein